MRFSFAFVALIALLPACDSGGGGGGAQPAATAGSPSPAAAPGTTPGAASPASPAAPVDVPVVFVHGILSDPVVDWGVLLPRLARGRELHAEVYAAETDLLPTGGVRRDSLFGFGYYRESATSPKSYTDRLPELPSIGACPLPRTDPSGGRFTISFASQLDRAVENICRATGSEQVDLVCYSMGGIVGRAYTRWLSHKGPGGRSRVRRLLTVGTMNHGLNSLEATALVLARGSSPAHLAQGEAAELNYQCVYWSGRSYIDLLNDGWDAFCAQQGIEYAAGYGYGNSFFDNALLQNLVTALHAAAGWLVPYLLVHPTPGFDMNVAGQEAMGDGDGIVRADSARMDPARYPGVAFNAPYYGTHSDLGQAKRAMFHSVWIEELVRRFIFEGRRGTGGAVAATGGANAVDAGGEATWLSLDLDVLAGTPVAAQAFLTNHTGTLAGTFMPGLGVGAFFYDVPLRDGSQRLMLDPAGAPDGDLRCDLRLFFLEGVVDLPAAAARIRRAGRPAAPAPGVTIGAPVRNAQGGIDVPLAVTPGPGEILWALEDSGGGVSWSAPQPAGPLSLPALPAGTYELRVRAAGAPNAAGLRVEMATPVAIRLAIDPAGGLAVYR